MSRHRRKRAHRVREAKNRATANSYRDDVTFGSVHAWDPATFNCERFIADSLAALASVRPLPKCPVCGKASSGDNTLCERCSKAAKALGVYGCEWCRKPITRGTLCDNCIPF